MKLVAEHLESVLSCASAIEPLEVGLLSSVGCVLADDICSEDESGQSHVLLSRGTAIGARHIALLAAAGLGRVLVHPKPRLVVLTVGDALVEPGVESEDGVPDINGISLTSAATAAGAMTFRVGPIGADAQKIADAIEDQLVRSDIIVTACGMSASDYDLLAGVVNSLGKVEFGRVAMSPGGAQGFGVIGPDSTPIFVLPGNPVGALLSFDLFVRPMIRSMMGHLRLGHPSVQAELEEDIESSADETRYVRAHLRDRAGVLQVKSVENDEQHPLGGLGTADAVIVVPPAKTKLKAGSKVTVMQLDA